MLTRRALDVFVAAVYCKTQIHMPDLALTGKVGPEQRYDSLLFHLQISSEEASRDGVWRIVQASIPITA